MAWCKENGIDFLFGLRRPLPVFVRQSLAISAPCALTSRSSTSHGMCFNSHEKRYSDGAWH